MVKETGMNTYGAVVIALGVVLTFVSPAWAQRTEPPPAFDPTLLGTTLYAGPLEGAGHWRCNVLNAGSTPLIVSVEIRNPAGTELAVDPDSQNCDEPVLPGHVCHGPDFGAEGLFYCAVRFFGSPASVRATLQLTNTDGISLSAEAR